MAGAFWPTKACALNDERPGWNGVIAQRLTAIVRAAQFRLNANLYPFEVPEQPHLDPESAPVFRSLQESAKRYVEFGSGGSTLQAGRIGLDTISVESDPAFARSVRRQMTIGAPVVILDARIGIVGEWGTPVVQRPTPARVRRWRRYVQLPLNAWAERKAFPDLALVDGRFRRACILEVVRRAVGAKSPVTIFFDDYYDRPGYHAVEPMLGQPKRIGRSAIFEVDGASGTPVIAVGDVEKAMHDLA
jgi:hypothetical protein